MKSSNGAIEILEGNYFVSRSGEVFNAKEHKISSWVGNTGYVKVKIHVRGFPKDRYVHRLVAEAYVPNPENLPQVKHKDDNKLNCNAES